MRTSHIVLGVPGPAVWFGGRRKSWADADRSVRMIHRPGLWQRWEHVLTSTRHYSNPYADVTLRVCYTGPGGRTLQAYGFWDGGDTFTDPLRSYHIRHLAVGDRVCRCGQCRVASCAWHGGRFVLPWRQLAVPVRIFESKSERALPCPR